MNGVPGATSGRVPDSQQNSPPDTCTCGTKKKWSAGSTKGLVNVTLICTSVPVRVPFPPVVWPGVGWIPPGCTEFSTEKLAASTPVENERSPDVALSRDANATSDGELTRVGTCDVEKVGAPDVRPT